MEGMEREVWRGYGGGIRRSGRGLLRSGWGETGQKNTVLTLYELTESEATLSQGMVPLVVFEIDAYRWQNSMAWSRTCYKRR